MLNDMVKAITRSALLTTLLVLLGIALWFNPLYTILTLLVLVVFTWLSFMLYVDPPDDWA